MLDLNKVYEGKIDCILDTDTYNEIDDQFALSFLLKNDDKLNLLAVTIAPFLNSKTPGVKESIELSYNEALKVLSLCERKDYFDKVYRGSTSFLSDANVPVESDACDYIIEKSKDYNKDNKLFIIAIGAITNIASAIIKDPTIVERIAVVWLGGSSYNYYINSEFNMREDLIAARIVMSKVSDFVLVPCQGVVSEFFTNELELKANLLGHGKLAEYLCNNTIDYAKEFMTLKTWSKVIWDVCAVAVLLNKNNKYMVIRQRKLRIPSLTEQKYEEELDSNIYYVERIHRDKLMNDLFEMISD